MASGDVDAKTPWAKIREDPTLFFDPDMYPDGFKFEDPSRMGKNVKTLLKHLRERQRIFGVNAFRFTKVWQNKTFQEAEYPEDARMAITPGEAVMDWPIPSVDPSSQVVTPEPLNSASSFENGGDTGRMLSPTVVPTTPDANPNADPIKIDSSGGIDHDNTTGLQKYNGNATTDLRSIDHTPVSRDNLVMPTINPMVFPMVNCIDPQLWPQ